ncbi:MAG TPA: peptidoglycan bridge formation glycyltransferase FemA/FemB family protein [Candidatus Dormibacteraeota bacterium]
MRPASPRELGRWDELVAENPDGGQILQTRAWGEFKRAHRWSPHYLVSETEPPVAILVLRHSAPGLGVLGYVPKGPGVAGTAELAALLEGLRATAGSAFAIKVEPEIEQSQDAIFALRAMGLEKSRHDVQISRATIIVGLRPNEDALIASFKPKCRYNIRLAERRGVTVAPVALDDASVDTMYSLMTSTRDRAGFTLRSKEYFSQYWHLQAAAGQGQLFFASLDGAVLAGVFATYIGKKAWYKDGGSTKEHAAVMAPYLLQWEVMRWLRARGVEAYDLVAVPPAAELNPAHPLFGLYRFKSGFSDRITEYVGTWDLAIRHRRYAAWNAVAERAAHQWAYRVRHDLLY